MSHVQLSGVRLATALCTGASIILWAGGALAKSKVKPPSCTSIQLSIDNQQRILEVEQPDSPAYGRSALALGQFQFDLADCWFAQAHEDDLEQAIFDAEEKKDASVVARLKAKQKGMLVKRDAARKAGVAVYRELIAKHGRMQRLDRVRFTLAGQLSRMGDKKAAMAAYQDLVRQHQTSKFVPDALVAVGDLFFEANSFGNAKTLYVAVVAKYPSRSKILTYAVYKQAWCEFNLGDTREAMRSFEDVIVRSRKQKGNGMLREAQNDVLIPYAQVGKGNPIAYLRKWAPRRVLKLGMRLATLWTEMNRYDRAAALLDRLVKTARASKTPHVAAQILRRAVSNAHTSGSKKATMAAVELLAKALDTDLRPAPRKFARTERTAVEHLLLGLASEFFKEYVSTKVQDTLDYTQRLNRLYLKLFPHRRNAGAVRMNRCQLLELLGKLEETASCYQRVLFADKKGKYAKEAAERLVLVSLKFHTTRMANASPKAGSATDLTKKDLSPSARRFLGAVSVWFGLVADVSKRTAEQSSNLPKALMLAGIMEYEHNHFLAAAKRFERVVNGWSDHLLAEDAALYLLSALNLAKDVQRLKRWADKLKAHPRLGKLKSVKDKLAAFYRGYDFLRCFEPEKRQEHAEAAQCFRAYAKQHSGSPKAAEALNNVAHNLFLDKRVEDAIRAYKALYDTFGRTNPLATKALFLIGNIFRDTAAYEEAVNIYEAFVSNHPKHGLAERALRYAAIYRKTLGHHGRAVQNLQLYLKQYGAENRKNAPRVHLDIIKVLANHGRPGHVVFHARQHARKFPQSPADVRLQVLTALGKAHRNKGKSKKAREAFDKTLALYGRLSPAARANLPIEAAAAVAEAQVNIAGGVVKASRRVAIEGSNAQIKKRTAKKLQLVERTRTLVARVIDVGHPGWAIAGYFLLGRAYEDLAESVEKSPVPRILRGKPLVVAEYRQGLIEEAEKLRKRAAIPAYRKAVAVARAEQWFNDWSDRAADALARMDLTDTSINEYRLLPRSQGPNRVHPAFKRPR